MSNDHYYYNTLFNQKGYLLLLLYLSRTYNSYCEFIIFLYLSYALKLYYCGLYYSVLFSRFVASNKHLVTIYTMNPFIHISLVTIHIGIYTPILSLTLFILNRRSCPFPLRWTYTLNTIYQGLLVSGSTQEVFKY